MIRAQRVLWLSVLLTMAFGCSNPLAPADEFEELRGEEMAQVIELYREGKEEEGRALARELIADPNWNVRSNAIRTIGEVGDKALLPEIHAALEDERLEVRESASRTLQWMGEQQSIPHLQAALSDPEPIVRSNAVEAIARIGGAATTGILIEVMATDVDLSVRAITASTLGGFPEPTVVAALIKALEEDDSAAVRARAALALGDIGDPEALSALKKATEDSELQVRRSAEEAIRRLTAR